MSARVAAARALAFVMSEGRTIDEALPSCLGNLASDRDRALAQELCYGVLRHFFTLDYAAGRLLRHPLRPGDADIRALLLSGIYQLGCLNIPDHAAVSETVEAARLLGKSWATGLVNAVLRRYRREFETFEAAQAGMPSAKFSHPGWLIEYVQADWPSVWESILEANNQRPPLHLRVNLRAITRERYLEHLAQAGVPGTASPVAESGVVLDEPMTVEQVPGFPEGLASVQDVGAQLAVPLLDLRSGYRVLDACAAPGGKTAHILESQPRLSELLALDRDERRLQRVRENLDRLNLDATLVRGDASRPDQWWDGRGFDRILFDAPCSATGVIRRHPDIKLLRAPDQFDRLCALQARLLESLWPLLNTGGRMLYSTCSVLRRENDEQIDKFTATHGDAIVLELDVPWGAATAAGRQTLPGPGGTDGFYYALLAKP
ncbi:MAG: 16S rRNA (cytosine(967)-C(5))-methyltransferase RsmB [Gammaproteobacteria bacterium]